MCPCKNKGIVPQSRIVAAPRNTIQNSNTRHSIHLNLPVVEPTLPTVDTSVWGPPLWTVLHTLSLVATDKTIWINIANALKTDLPCPDCSEHYNTWVRSNPLQFPVSPPPRQLFIPRFIKTRDPAPLPPVSDTIGRWVLALHNNVNTRRGVGTWGYEQCKNNYSNIYAAKTALIHLDGVIGNNLVSLLKTACA
jgi:hypothetical protein